MTTKDNDGSQSPDNGSGLQAWKDLWTPYKKLTNIIPANMRADWQAWFDNVKPNTAVAWCGGTLVKMHNDETVWYMNGSYAKFDRNEDLAAIASKYPTIHNAFRDTYNYSPNA